MVNIYLLRKEYKKFGYTSINLRAFWFIALTFELAFIFLSDLEYDRGIDKPEIINFCYVAFLFVLNIFGWAKVKDSPEVTIEEQTIGYLRIESGSNNLLNRIRESFSSKNGTNSEKKNIPYDELRDRRNNKKEYELFNEQDLETSLNQKIYSEEIEEIGITGHEEVIKNDKTSIAYQILYLLNKNIMKTKRTYSEFFRLYTKTQDSFSREKLPVFPQKKDKQESLRPNVIEDRKIKFEKILAYICENKLYTNYLFEFLKPEDEIPCFSYMVGNESIKASYLVQNSNNPIESVVSGNKNSQMGESDQSKQSKGTGRSLSFNQPLNPNEARSFLEESGSSKVSRYSKI